MAASAIVVTAALLVTTSVSRGPVMARAQVVLAPGGALDAMGALLTSPLPAPAPDGEGAADAIGGDFFVDATGLFAVKVAGAPAPGPVPGVDFDPFEGAFDGACVLSDLSEVPVGWRGRDAGERWCHTCACLGGVGGGAGACARPPWRGRGESSRPRRMRALTRACTHTHTIPHTHTHTRTPCSCLGVGVAGVEQGGDEGARGVLACTKFAEVAGGAAAVDSSAVDEALGLDPDACPPLPEGGPDAFLLPGALDAAGSSPRELECAEHASCGACVADGCAWEGAPASRCAAACLLDATEAASPPCFATAEDAALCPLPESACAADELQASCEDCAAAGCVYQAAACAPECAADPTSGEPLATCFHTPFACLAGGDKGDLAAKDRCVRVRVRAGSDGADRTHETAIAHTLFCTHTHTHARTRTHTQGARWRTARQRFPSAGSAWALPPGRGAAAARAPTAARRRAP